MILIVTHKEDYTADFIIEKLNRKKIKYHRLNTEDIGTKHKITFTEKNIKIDEYSSFDSVWFRRTKHPKIKFESKEEEKCFFDDFSTFLNNIWKCIDTKKWLSIPYKIYKAEDKLFQLRVAKSLKFSIPETIVTTCRQELKFFYKKHNGNIIIKPLNRGSFLSNNQRRLVFTNRLKKEHIENQVFLSFPIIFQEEIKKIYEVRVTVVADKVFAAKVESQKNKNTIVDWRREKLIFKAYNLPEEMEIKCLNLVKTLGLNFGAIDLIRTDNNYVFLEINPNGQWAWIETETSMRISDTIIDFLN